MVKDLINLTEVLFHFRKNRFKHIRVDRKKLRVDKISRIPNYKIISKWKLSNQMEKLRPKTHQASGKQLSNRKWGFIKI